MQNVANATEKVPFPGKHNVGIHFKGTKTQKAKQNTTTFSTPLEITAAPKLMLTISHTKCI